MADPLLDLTAELGEPLLVVGAEERARWHQPIVYAWLRGDEVLYVGCSWRGLERPLGAGHEKLRLFEPGDQLVVWPCADPGPVEDALIRRWRPRFNLPSGGAPCPGCGGRWKLSDRAANRWCWLCQTRAANGFPPYRQAPSTISKPEGR